MGLNYCIDPNGDNWSDEGEDGCLDEYEDIPAYKAFPWCIAWDK